MIAFWAALKSFGLFLFAHFWGLCRVLFGPLTNMEHSRKLAPRTMIHFAAFSGQFYMRRYQQHDGTNPSNLSL